MTSYDPIDDALNTSSNSIEVSTTPEGGCAKRKDQIKNVSDCLLYTSPSPRD